MPTYQRNANVLVAARRESTTGVQATATGAIQVRILDSPGLDLKRAPIQSQERRTDLLMSLARLGFKSVEGTYNTELTIGGHTDSFLEAVMRGTWSTATSFAFSSVTTVAIDTNTVTAGPSSSWITQGVKVGDIFTIAGTTTTANNGLNTRVLSLTTLTLTVATNTFVTLAASATGTITILKKLKSPTTPTRYSYTFEEYDADTDLSELFLGVRIVGAKLSCKPGQPATIAFTCMGLDHSALTTGTSPYFTSPSLTTGLALVVEDSTIRYNGASAAQITGVDIEWKITAAGQPVIGSTSSPDIFDDSMDVSVSATMLRSDFSNLTAYDAETEFDLSLLFQEPNTGTPKSCLSFFLPRVKIGDLSAPAGGGDGAKIETLQLMVGPKVATSVYDAGVMTIHSSAA